MCNQAESVLYKLKVIITAASSLILPEEKELQSDLMDYAQKLLEQLTDGAKSGEGGK
ncbi:hypothetical protein LHS21_000131 [Salmonella enterica subsp. enterica serovar Newport]|uniref:Uncharacterized protein n=1 Tax=Salmonella enterica TaxID=28901 RepID=A0A743PBL6_SALER|nr:hypothetical protein [Salmonella enterica subsp. enterica serovar Newport]HAF2126697.1 hypothetical protein [Salmonella enterica]